MEEFKRFVLVIKMIAEENALKKMGHIPACHECASNIVCPILEKSTCPMKNLIGVSSENMYVTDADGYRMIKECINAKYPEPKITLLLLIDFRKHIGHIYKADGDLRTVRGDILTNLLVRFKHRFKKDVRLIEIRDEREKMPKLFGKN